MKKLQIILLSLFFIILCYSCKTDVDLFVDGKETTIVYGYLDCDSDTNYLKITKSFIGNASELAQNYQTNNYDYKLSVKLIGKFNDKPNIIDTAIFDTISVYKPYDPNSYFYSDINQVLYYTSKKLKENEDYQLIINRKDGEIITSNVKTLSDFKIKKPYNMIDFDSDRPNQVKWQHNNFNNFAAYYEVYGYFHYKQLNPGKIDTIDYTMKWFMGSGTRTDLYISSDRILSVNYTPNDLYSKLSANDNIKFNSPYNVKRFVDNFEIIITATGDELYNYILINNSSSAIQDTPEYTNINNGMGIFSSRVKCSKKFKISPNTINKLIRNYPDWGFVYIP